MIKINITSKTAEAKITSILEDVQARCKARTIDFRDIELALDNVEKKIGIPKCRLDGTTVTVDVHGADFPSAYKYTPESTIFSAANIKGKWYITSIKRSTTRRFNQRVACTLSEAAKSAVVERLSRFSI